MALILGNGVGTGGVGTGALERGVRKRVRGNGPPARAAGPVRLDGPKSTGSHGQSAKAGARGRTCRNSGSWGRDTPFRPRDQAGFPAAGAVSTLRTRPGASPGRWRRRVSWRRRNDGAAAPNPRNTSFRDGAGPYLHLGKNIPAGGTRPICPESCIGNGGSSIRGSAAEGGLDAPRGRSPLPIRPPPVPASAPRVAGRGW